MHKNYSSGIRFLFCLNITLILASCQVDQPRLSNAIKPDLDSLWVSQINFLKLNKATLEKEILMNDSSEVSQAKPKDSLAWANELEILRAIRNLQLASNLPLYEKKTYKDTSSNLEVTSYTATKKLPLRKLKIFETRENQVKKIEAEFSEQNVLLANEKKISLFFSEVNNKNILTSYLVKGYQHMVLSDTMKFELKAKITIQ